MGKIKRIFLDLDGVICNWSKMACSSLGVEYPKDFLFPKQTWLQTIVPREKIDKCADELEFWTELEKFPWSDEIVKMVANSGKEWRFLTKPMKHPNCYAGKAAWMFKHYPQHWDRMWIVTGTKSATCRGAGDLLIDDMDQNIEEWRNVGGTAFEWKEITPDYSLGHQQRLEALKRMIHD